VLSSDKASEQDKASENNPSDGRNNADDYFGFKRSVKKTLSTNGDGSQRLALQYDEKLAKVHDLKEDASTKIK
jgi:hypothetical protein